MPDYELLLDHIPSGLEPLMPGHVAASRDSGQLAGRTNATSAIVRLA